MTIVHGNSSIVKIETNFHDACRITGIDAEKQTGERGILILVNRISSAGEEVSSGPCLYDFNCFGACGFRFAGHFDTDEQLQRISNNWLELEGVQEEEVR